jgi:hypothetical protein
MIRGPFFDAEDMHAALAEALPHPIDMRHRMIAPWHDMRNFCLERYGPEARFWDVDEKWARWKIDTERRWCGSGTIFYFLNWHEAVEFKLNWY